MWTVSPLSCGAHSAVCRGSRRDRQTAKQILAGLDVENDPVMKLCVAFSSLCRKGELEAALTLLTRCIQAGRETVLRG